MRTEKSCPLSRGEITDLYFMEHRAKLIDIAAFLDRLDRARDGGDDDFRMRAFRKAAALLVDDQPQRAKRVLELFSDHTEGMPVSAEGTKGATGAAPEVSS